MYRHDEHVATDTVYSDTPDVDYGFTRAQLFYGTKSLVSYVYSMKLYEHFVNTLEDNINAQVSMSKLISNCDKYEVRNCAQSILQALFIDDRQSEPHYQHQNFAEHRYHTVTYINNTIMNLTDSFAYEWLLDLINLLF